MARITRNSRTPARRLRNDPPSGQQVSAFKHGVLRIPSYMDYATKGSGAQPSYILNPKP